MILYSDYINSNIKINNNEINNINKLSKNKLIKIIILMIL